MIKQVKSFAQKVLFRTQYYYECAKWAGIFFIRCKNKGVHIVVCGYPRSGTSMFYNMLSSSLMGFSFTEDEKSALKIIWKNGNFITKCPHDVIKLSRGKIQELNVQNKKIVVFIIIRDLRDIVTSKHQWAPEDYMIGYKDETIVITGRYPDYLKRFIGPGIGKFYKAIKSVEKSENLSTMIIKYEDLISNPEQFQNAIKKRFGIQFDGKFSEYYLRKERHRLRYEGSFAPIDENLKKSSSKITGKYVNRWQASEHRDRITDQFSNNPELFDILIEYGYESSTDWYDGFLNKS